MNDQRVFMVFMMPYVFLCIQTMGLSIGALTHFVQPCSYGNVCSFTGNVTDCNMTVGAYTFPVNMTTASSVTLYSCKKNDNVTCYYSHVPLTFGATVGTDMFRAQCADRGEQGYWIQVCVWSSLLVFYTLVCFTVWQCAEVYKPKKTPTQV